MERSSIQKEYYRDVRNKIITYSMVFILLIIFFTLLFLLLKNPKFDSSKDAEFQKLDMKGYYLVDGGEWVAFDSLKDIPENFESISIRGTFLTELEVNDEVIIPMYGERFRMLINGEEVMSFGQIGTYRFSHGPGYGMWYRSVGEFMPNGIGYEDEICLEITNVYYKANPGQAYKYLNKMVSGEDIVFFRIFRDSLVDEAVSLMIIAIAILALTLTIVFYSNNRRKKYSGFSFSHFALTAGLYSLLKSSHEFMPLIVRNPTLCAYLDNFALYLMLISFSLYVLFNLVGRKTIQIMYIFVWVLLVIAVLAFCIQFSGYRDLYEMQFLIVIPGVVSIMTGAICLLYDTFYYKNSHSWLLLLILAPFILALFMSLADTTHSNVYMRYGIFTCAILHLIEMGRFYKENKQREAERIRIDRELMESRVLIMQSQIQPHFLYNSLSTIQILCDKNPHLAGEAVAHFSNYLRMNMDSLKVKECVSFERELAHLDNYLFIEQLRFRDLLHIEYDIQVKSFMCPPLTVQPLVENAVKHGVGKKEEGGTIKISTWEEEQCFCVCVEDDGVGFDVRQRNSNDGRSHVGLENTAQRLYEMCGGDLEVESEPGEGTKVYVRIPKERRR